ncbi:Ger(x)C family spore germination protein [Fictibacillus phosphorivorans]|uniref:Ger(x)C family spore germination protein n=1 Tax=Fictibacillus phosphorivorans TaxID=1221500 RepID=UPI001293791D|nr:Ger(x)C family spore germination protein [Fictibacillus phosphorivorans]MQR94508.1 Ger(x)C family spore germination protein [Fictibacillus phosphorivorans]
MFKQILYIIIISLLLLTTGCWDQRLLKNSTVILGTAVDLTENKKVAETVTFPGSSSGIDTPQTTMLVTGIGDTTKDAKASIERKIAEKFDSSKNRVTLIGEDMAKQGVYSPLDSFYRDYQGSLGANVAVIDGKAKEALTMIPKDTPVNVEYFANLFKSAAMDGLIENHNIQEICTIMFSKGEDFLLPYLRVNKSEKRTKIIGMAMFNKDKMVGSLSIHESRMFLLLNNHKSKNATFTIKVSDKEKSRLENYINLSIKNIKRDFQVIEKNGAISAKIKLSINLGVNEYPKDHLDNKKKLKVLDQHIENQFTKIANRTIDKLHAANCDGLGLGLRVKAKYPEVWNKINWNRDYPTIPIAVDIESTIVDNGIIN